MEDLLAALGGGHAEDALEAAQEVIYDAWDATTQRKRIALARKALAISPLCADAYVLLAENEAKSSEEALLLFRKAVAAGEQALGPAGFEEYAGHFWGFLETRPYMRARAGLAATLAALGRREEAITHYQDMLRLNPGDNQGIRYVLASCLMKHGGTEALRSLFKKYDGDASAHWLYSRALFAFREEGRSEKAGKFAKSGMRANEHVPPLLAGRKAAKPSTDGYIRVGGEDEAADYTQEWGAEWKATPGAIDWLMEVAAGAMPAGAGRRR